jgi:hypothetical protein
MPMPGDMAMTSSLLKGLFVLSAALLVAGSSFAQSDADADMRLKFKLLYETRHADFYCFNDREKSTDFKDASIDWIWDLRRRVATIREAVGGGIVNAMEVDFKRLHDDVTPILNQCDRGDVYHVQVLCIGNCVTEYHPDTLVGVLARKLKKLMRLQRDTMYFTFKEEKDAKEAVDMLKDLIRAAKE